MKSVYQRAIFSVPTLILPQGGQLAPSASQAHVMWQLINYCVFPARVSLTLCPGLDPGLSFLLESNGRFPLLFTESLIHVLTIQSSIMCMLSIISGLK